MLHNGNCARRQRAHSGVENFKMKALKIGDVASHMKGGNLPSALSRHLEGTSKPFDQTATAGRSVAFTNNVLIGLQLYDARRKEATAARASFGKSQMLSSLRTRG